MKNTKMKTEAGGEIVLYQPDESVKLEVRLDPECETVWLNRMQMAELFGRDVKTIGKHVNNALREELAPEIIVTEPLNNSTLAKNATVGAQSVAPQSQKVTTVAKFATVQMEGEREVIRQVEYYNLDVILSVGYRVKSNRGIQFRRWANTVLKDYLLRGYSLNLHLVALQERTDERFQAIQSQIDEQKDKVDFLVKIHDRPTEQLFPTGCVFDAFSYMAGLIRSAKERVVLVDNYCDDKTMTLLGQRAPGVECVIHTTFNKIFEVALEKHNSQYEPITKIQLPHKIHDRFLMVDQQVYLLGTSLKDMGHTLSAAILTGFTPQEILNKLK